jgi:hypothetical protein
LNMIPGHRYHMIYRSGTQRVDHYLVLDFLAEGSGIDEGSYLMNARPMAGTQPVPKRWVISVEEVDKSTKLVLNRVVGKSYK